MASCLAKPCVVARRCGQKRAASKPRVRAEQNEGTPPGWIFRPIPRQSLRDRLDTGLWEPREFYVRDGKVTIAPRGNVELPYWASHAEADTDSGGKLVVRPLDATTIRVDGKPIGVSGAEIKDGSTVEFGDERLRFHVEQMRSSMAVEDNGPYTASAGEAQEYQEKAEDGNAMPAAKDGMSNAEEAQQWIEMWKVRIASGDTGTGATTTAPTAVPEREGSEPDGSTPARSQFMAVLSTTLGVAALLITDKLLEKAWKMIFGISGAMPHLFGMAMILSSLLLFEALGKVGVSDGFRRMADPGIGFIARWLPVFYSPSIVLLPLAVRGLSVQTLSVMVAITAGGLVSTLWFAGFVTSFVRRFTRTEPDPRDPPKPGKPYTGAELSSLAMLWVVGFALASSSSSGSALQGLGCVSGMVSGTAGGYALGTKLPSLIQRVCHPLLSCAIIANVAASLLGASTRQGWEWVLRTYKGGFGNQVGIGGGDVLMAFLGPVILSFAFRVYDERRTMRKHGAELVTGSALAALFSLLSTPLICRLAGLDSAIARAMAPRSVTAALAAPIAASLGVGHLSSVTLAVVVLTGLLGGSFCVQMLNLFGIRDTITRGMATAASSHGVGTATLSAREPDALPFCALTYVVTGVLATLFASIPIVQKAIFLLAGAP